jgi:hypothetical protein
LRKACPGKYFDLERARVGSNKYQRQKVNNSILLNDKVQENETGGEGEQSEMYKK